MFETIDERIIEHRRQTDPEFRRLHDQHRKLDRKIENAEHQLEGLTDEHLHDLKVQRLRLKEKLLRRFSDLEECNDLG